MPSEFDIISAAATRTGNNPVTSYDQGDAVANLAAANYELKVTTELGSNRWHFATKFEVIQVLDEDVHGAPPEPWLYGYQLPTDFLVLRTIMSGGLPIAYAQMKNKIFANVGTDSAVYAHYTYRVPEPEWPPFFAEAMIIRLEALILRGFERHEEADAREKDAIRAFAMARRLDAQSQSPVNPVRSPTLDARRGHTANVPLTFR